MAWLEPPRGERTRTAALPFAVAIFASACLIFLVQPMVGKRILPWFGGAPAVWTVCLAFYQTALFAGYAYAHLLVRRVGPRLQLALHSGLLLLALLSLPILPSDRWRPDGSLEPGAFITALLVANLALPFVALAATGPLLQAWFARLHPERSPYPLYAVSNLGSLLALVAYPFLLEPRLPLSHTDRLWSGGFFVTAIAVVLCAILARHAPAQAASSGLPPAPAPLEPSRVALWLLLPACAVVLLMGVTNELCLDVASVPFLWILPLAVYLVTFVASFASDRESWRLPWWLVAAAPLGASLAVGRFADPEGPVAGLAGAVQLQIAVQSVLLFGACMLLHGELHRLRPAAGALTTFYLCVAAGGALGGLFVGLAAPRLFDDYHELQLGLALGWLLLLAARWHASRGWLRRGAPRWRWALAALSTLALLVGWIGQEQRGGSGPLYRERTFFGVLRVREAGEGRSRQRHLYSGTTLHGIQYARRERQPTSYYGIHTGIGMLLTARPPDGDHSIGVVGLGVGTLAAYGRPGDRLRFYEIDPAVIRLAQDEHWFSFLSRSAAEIEIVVGDARIALEGERAAADRPRFDLLVLDAFSSDAIPVHLLTREAVSLYLDSIRHDGVIAVHASSRGLDLVPVIARQGAQAGLEVLTIETQALPRFLTGQSVWLFLSRDAARISELERLAGSRRQQLRLEPGAIVAWRPPVELVQRAPLWTDDYSDLFRVLRPLPIRIAFE